MTGLSSLLLVSVLTGLALAQEASNSTVSNQPYRSFNSTPVQLNYTVSAENPGALTPGSLFFCPRLPTDPAFSPGPLIVANDGQLVWDGTAEPYNFGQAMAFEPGTYKGEEVLALWQGQFFGGGYGNGYGLILNASYDVVANVTSTIEGEGNDFHEFKITNNNTAMFMVYAAKEHDLSQYNVQTEDGTSGWIFDNYVQEIDIETGEALFTWSALDHLDPTQGYADPGDTGVSREAAWDFLHLNSVDKDSAGNYLISSRHFSTVFYVSPAGDILWELNGRNSSFQMGEGTEFHFQHDARWIDEGTRLSLFDNAASSWTVSEPRARGLILVLDMAAMTCTLEHEYLPYVDEASPSQGNARQQPNDDMLLGFGSQPWASEYNAAGDLLWAAHYPDQVQAYRMVRANWTGSPHTTPSVYVSTSADNNTAQAFISWNGDARVTQWRVYASQDNSTSATPMTFDKAGFETMVDFQLEWPENVNVMYVWAEGVNSGGEVVGTSSQTTVQKEGQGGSVTDQSGVGNSVTESSGNSTTNTSGGSNGSESGTGSGTAGGDAQNGATALSRFPSWSAAVVGTGLVAWMAL